jgi:hypothetical protein
MAAEATARFLSRQFAQTPRAAEFLWCKVAARPCTNGAQALEILEISGLLAHLKDSRWCTPAGPPPLLAYLRLCHAEIVFTHN